MGVTRLDISSRERYENGTVFGDGGSYERVDGVLHFAVDAAAPANAPITDLDKSERGPDGLVHFLADFCLLQPVEPARGNRRLLLDVVNRGRKNLTGIFNRSARPLEPSLVHVRVRRLRQRRSAERLRNLLGGRLAVERRALPRHTTGTPDQRLHLLGRAWRPVEQIVERKASRLGRSECAKVYLWAVAWV